MADLLIHAMLKKAKQIEFNVMKKIIVIVKQSFLFLIWGYSALGFAAELNCNKQDIHAMHAAIKAYIENDSKGASEGITIKSERCLSNYASAIVHYSQPEYDDQIAYLHHGDGWKVLGVATGFDGDFMDNIPEPIQQ